MKTTRLIASILLYFFRILSIAYLLTALHILVSTLFRLSTLKLLENNRFAITYPFSNKVFLLGSEFTKQYITEMIFIIGFYGLFFYLLSHVFYTFKQHKLFTVNGVKNLKYFHIFNLYIAPAILLILEIISLEDLPYIGMIIAHFIIGIFAFFIESIFRQGLNLQNEQDLFI